MSKKDLEYVLEAVHVLVYVGLLRVLNGSSSRLKMIQVGRIGFVRFCRLLFWCLLGDS